MELSPETFFINPVNPCALEWLEKTNTAINKNRLLMIL